MKHELPANDPEVTPEPSDLIPGVKFWRVQGNCCHYRLKESGPFPEQG